MDSKKRERLIKKYENFTASRASGGGGMTIGRAGGNMARNAMGKSGKPKNALHTLVKLSKYISEQRVLFVVALICAIVNAVATLAASYMLRPIMNNFLYYDADNPRIELEIYPCDYIGVFDNASQLEGFESNCIGCNRYKRNCSLLKKAKEGRIQEEIQYGICTKFKN